MSDKRDHHPGKEERGYQPDKRKPEKPGKVEGGYQPEKSSSEPKPPPKKP